MAENKTLIECAVTKLEFSGEARDIPNIHTTIFPIGINGAINFGKICGAIVEGLYNGGVKIFIEMDKDVAKGLGFKIDNDLYYLDEKCKTCDNYSPVNNCKTGGPYDLCLNHQYMAYVKKEEKNR